MNAVRAYFEFEADLVRQFGLHPFLRGMSTVPDEAFVGFLLQLGHLSTEFVRWYEQAKLGFDREDAKEVIRGILRDEIPQRLPTHQDDRLSDLLMIGVSKARVLNEPASSVTKRTVRRMYELVRYPQHDYDLRVLQTLRVFGEVLVGETYRVVTSELERRYQLGPEKSRFFWPHYKHDALEAVGGHTSAFDELLGALIVDDRTLAVAKAAATQAFRLRYRFYNQF